MNVIKDDNYSEQNKDNIEELLIESAYSDNWNEESYMDR